MRAQLSKSVVVAACMMGCLLGGSVHANVEARSPASEPLYFALEVRQAGRLLAHPKLLGEAGKTLRVERRQAGAPEADYRFSLHPVRLGDKYQVDFALQLPNAHGRSALALLPGEVRRIELGHSPGDLQVSLLLMRVDSPEFRALMDLSGERTRNQAHGSI